MRSIGHWLWLPFVVAISVVSIDAASFDSKTWNDGRAEVAVYDSSCMMDGKPITFREHLLVTKEEVRADTLAKPLDPKKEPTIPVFKFIQVQRFDLENYPRNIMTTVIVKADSPQSVLKMTSDVQDWTGNTFRLLKASPDGTESTMITYSLDPGSSEQPTELAFTKDSYIDQQLPLSLRALPFKDGLQQSIKLWDLVSTENGLYPKPMAATLSVSGPEEVRGHAGTLPCWLVTIARSSGTSTTDLYWFEKADPHLLVKMETADGRKRLLYGRARWSYWDRRLRRPNILN